ncbi:unnamed protein product [Adineta steineri]|uniref:Uncharacterized protein n=1 Tax=Adineta steineri TaxID=433720 RepID=A0A813V8W0_9BILA|nr:unnamed protein product [Adineta steineri]CAF3755022.1 unnamed protein product [Adineta steineri]
MNQATSGVGHSRFQGLMKQILPHLSTKEEQQIENAFQEYNSMLNITKTFITNTTLLVSRARSRNDISNAIDSNTLQTLCNEAKRLTQEIRDISVIVKNASSKATSEALSNLFSSLITGRDPTCTVLAAFNLVYTKLQENAVENLEKLKSLLVQLSQHYATIQGYDGELRMEDKNDFLSLLKQTEEEVEVGYKLLSEL